MFKQNPYRTSWVNLYPRHSFTYTEENISQSKLNRNDLVSLGYTAYIQLSLLLILGILASNTFLSYGRTGYQKHVQKYTDPVQTKAAIQGEGADGVDLTGKVVAVTGANSGLGKEVATYCAAKGAKLYMLCRSKERAEQAKQEIVKETGNQNVEIILVDVAELSQVREAAKTLNSKEEKIHALVCNAGVLLRDRKESSEGHELTFASHLLGGSFLLPSLLRDKIRAADGEGRVIFVTSGGMYNFPLPSWDSLSGAKSVKYDGVNAYAYAKRAQVLLAERWAQEETDISFVTVHPGWADTPAVDDAFGDMKKYLKPLRDPWEGAEGVAWLVATSRSKLESGALYLDRKVEPKHLAGPFFTEGSYTKNKPAEVDEMMAKLKEASGLS